MSENTIEMIITTTEITLINAMEVNIIQIWHRRDIISNPAGMGATMINKNTTDAWINSIEVIHTIVMASIIEMNSIIGMIRIIKMISIIKTINTLLMM